MPSSPTMLAGPHWPRSCGVNNVVGRRGEVPLVPPDTQSNFKLDGAVEVFVGCVESSRRTGSAVVVRLEDSTHPTELKRRHW